MAINDKLAKRNLFIMMGAQVFSGAQMPMLFIVAGLAGQSFDINICWATLPISLIVFGSMTTAPWLSSVMQNFGRRLGFIIGSFGGAIGGALGAYALFTNSFPLFLIASYFTGIYMSAQAFMRFAAIDTASEEFRPKAISYLMAVGLVPAILGPQLVKLTADMFVIPFIGVYLSVVIINIIGSVFFLFLRIPLPRKIENHFNEGRSRLELLKSPKITVSIICAMVSYALMNLVMTSTPLAVVGCGFDHKNAADIVMAHVLGMFVPSFFTGHLIIKYGAPRIISIGLLILAFAGVSNLLGIELINFYVGLIFLGIGWNFGFIGATTMLASSYKESERGKAQGMNDFFVFGFVTLASLASGSLMNCSAETPVEGWTSVNLAMIPFLILAGCSLIWLSKKSFAQSQT